MKVAIDISPLKSGHQFRGIGSYTKNLIEVMQLIKTNDFSVKLIRDGQMLKDCDLIHYPYFDLFWLTLPLRKAKPTVVTIHDVIPLVFPDKFPPGVKGWLKFRVQKWSLLSAKAVITDSESSQKDIFKYLNYPKEKIFVIPLAPGKEFKKLKINPLAGGLPDTFVLYVGDVNYNKNVLGLAEACKKIKMPLVIVGKQAAQEDFDQAHVENQPLVQLIKIYGKDKEVIRLGFVPTEDLVKIYNLATVYCQPSFYEGFGLSVLEAMACGCPVVAAKTSSLPEICGQAAIMVDPNDINSIAGGIKKALENKESLRLKGLKQVKKFSWRKTAQETVKVYEKVFNQGK